MLLAYETSNSLGYVRALEQFMVYLSLDVMLDFMLFSFLEGNFFVDSMVMVGLQMEDLRCWSVDNQLPEDTRNLFRREEHSANNFNHDGH